MLHFDDVNINCDYIDSMLEDRSTNKPIVRETEKVGRNSPCTCGSGKKYKKCCGVLS